MLNPKNIYQLTNHPLVFGRQGNRHLWTSFSDTPCQNNCLWKAGEQPARPSLRPPRARCGAEQGPGDFHHDPGQPLPRHHSGFSGNLPLESPLPSRRESLFSAGASSTSALAPSRHTSRRLHLSSRSLQPSPALWPPNSTFVHPQPSEKLGMAKWHPGF